MAGIYKSTYGHFGGRKDFDTAEIRTTPADELSSWLSDDVCTQCGGPTKHGKLFCSDACKLADADEVAQVSRGSLGHHTASGLVSPSRADTFAKDDSADKFRYPCPPSPNLLAQYSTPLRATSLTSPALSAYQSSLPSARGRYTRASNSSSDAFSLPSHKKRSSSQSTFSSVSESNGSTSAFASTDPSTPSPALPATEDESSDLDANDFQLPPSVSTASAVMLRRKTRDSPKNQVVPLPSVGRRPSEASQQKSPMWFARRPSTTNMPPTMWYTSPAVTATTKITATARGLPGINAQRGDAQATLTKKAFKDFLAQSRKTSAPTSPQQTGLAGVAMRRGHSDQVGARSPPQIQSAASSAGKTMRAVSPDSHRALSPATGTEAPCDRCRTLSNLSGDLDIYATSVRSRSGSRRGSASSGDTRSLLHKHKHSHSAAAGLFFTQLHAREEQEVAAAAADAPATPSQAAARSAAPRGRSAARVRGSTQRSRSPPRAAARRQTSDDHGVRAASPVPISPKSIPISTGSNPRTTPVDNTYHHDESLRSALPQRPSPLALKTHLEEQKGQAAASPPVDRGRGRDRGMSSTRTRSPERRSWIQRDCEVTWAGYGHRSTDRGSPSPDGIRAVRSRRGRSMRNHDPGFDEVDLELDGDISSASSDAGSFESSPRRGRTASRRA